jgi:hypothetical protein
MNYAMSPVNYKAWQEGYMPPSEHLLIDALSFRGAKVAFQSSMFGTEYWLVMKGKPVHGRRALAIINHIDETIMLMAEDAADPADPPPVVHDAFVPFA